MSYLIRNNISLLVCDMAGTIVNENGLIYKSIFNTLKNIGYDPNEKDISNWTGLSKKKVLYDEILKRNKTTNSTKIMKDVILAEELLIQELETQYFKNNNIELISDDLLVFFDECRMNGIKIALNTGYSSKLQNKIIDHLCLDDHIDAKISSDDVVLGRPYPYMINKLLYDFNIINTKHIAKIGDTKNDMMEGRNANCGLTIGVLSGYEDKDTLIKYGANVVVNNITDLKDNDLPIFLL